MIRFSLVALDRALNELRAAGQYRLGIDRLKMSSRTYEDLFGSGLYGSVMLLDDRTLLPLLRQVPAYIDDRLPDSQIFVRWVKE